VTTVPFFFLVPPDASRTSAASRGAHSTCMGLFSRFCVWARGVPPHSASKTRVNALTSVSKTRVNALMRRCAASGDTRSLVLRAHGESIQLQCIML